MGVYVVDPLADYYTALHKAREDSGDRGFIYVPDRTRQAGMAKRIEESQSGMVLLPFETNNTAFDDSIYAFCQEIAGQVANGLRRGAGGLSREHEWSFAVALQDRLVGRLRPAEHLRFLLQQQRKSLKIRYIPADRPTDLFRVLSVAVPRVKAIGPVPQLDMMKTFLRIAGGGRAMVFTPEQLARASEGGGKIFICGSLADQQYRNTIFPVVRRALDDYEVVFMPSAPLAATMTPERFYAEHGWTEHINSGRLLVMDQSKPLTVENINWQRMTALAKIARQTWGKTTVPEFEHLYGAVLRDIVVEEAAKLETACLSLFPQMQEMVKAAAAVVVCPGRHMRSNLLVAAAIAEGTPTAEIQSGTISKSRRFVRPAAEIVLAMDAQSKETYQFLGKKKGIEIIGSIRLDYDLAPFRGVTKGKARKKLGLPGGEIWMLASQPIGIQMMTKVAEVVLQAAAMRGGVTVLIKMHPNETEAYITLYRELAERYTDVSVLVEQQAKSVLAAIASDVVLTHFSTVGVESFALRRPTVAVNPFDATLSFDLVGMGVAHEAKTAEDIVAFVASGASQFKKNKVLTDGQALERCQAVIRSMSKGSDLAVPAPRRPITVELAMKQAWRRLPNQMKRGLIPLARFMKARLR